MCVYRIMYIQDHMFLFTIQIHSVFGKAAVADEGTLKPGASYSTRGSDSLNMNEKTSTSKDCTNNHHDSTS